MLMYVCAAIGTVKWKEGLGGGPIGSGFCQLDVYGGRQTVFTLVSVLCSVIMYNYLLW